MFCKNMNDIRTIVLGLGYWAAILYFCSGEDLRIEAITADLKN
jgi:hypothetical protein